MRISIGIDIAKAKFDAAYIAPNGTRRHTIFSNDYQGFRLLKRWLKLKRPTLIMESTGNYWQKLAHWSKGQGWEVAIVNPQQSKAYAKSIGKRSKTDKQDAFLLARYGEKEQPTLWQIPQKSQTILEQLSRQLKHIKQQLHIENNRLKTTPEILHPHIKRSIAFLQKENKILEDALARHIAKNKELKTRENLLLTIPGIGKKTAQSLLAFIGDPKRFKSAKNLVSLAGLAPREKQSGASLKAPSRIGRAGNSFIRHALFMPAVAAGFGKYPKYGDYAQRLEQKGKRRKVIVVALMRKILVLAYSVLYHKRPFDPEYQTIKSG